MIRRALACAALVLVTACSSPPVPLPGSGPQVVRDAVSCGGRFYVVGGLAGPSPAAWESTDGRSWRSLTFAPLPGSYYGPQNVLYSVACANGTVAAIGSRSGGAHGNPRVSTWYQRPDGVLAEAPAPFETYGGDTAVDVGRIAGGPAGFLIAGNRTSGAAAWISADGQGFQLVENAPGLAGAGTLARAGVVLDGEFVLVGGVAGRGLDQAAAAWTSRDGLSWSRVPVPSEPGYLEMQRVVSLGRELIAVGVRGDTFGAWRRAASGEWTVGGRFGRMDAGGIRSLTVVSGRAYAASAREVWRSDDRGLTWRDVSLPSDVGELSALAGQDDQLLVVAGDRVWRL